MERQNVSLSETDTRDSATVASQVRPWHMHADK